MVNYAYITEKKLGCWRETAKRRAISIATDPLSAIATIVSSAVSDSNKVHIKSAIFEWAFKVTSLIPSFSSASKKPKILRVISNITKKPFKIGDKIIVGAEGTPGCDAYFSIEPLLKNIAMAEKKNGIYEGIYVVKEGDRLKSGTLSVTLVNNSGAKRSWIEYNTTVKIDGIPPQTALSVKAIPTKNTIKLNWSANDPDIVGFIIKRSLSPFAGYKKIAYVNSLSFEDKNVKPGKDYFYRVISEDSAGNTSKPVQVGPVRLPYFTTQILPDTVVSDINSGVYLVKGLSKIPLGSNVNISNAKLIFSNGSRLSVEGNLTMNSVFISKKQHKVDKDNRTVNNDALKTEKDNKTVDNKTANNKTNKLDNKTAQQPEIVVLDTGNLKLKNSQIAGNVSCLIKGRFEALNSSFVNGKTSLIINSLQPVKIENNIFKNLTRAITIEDGNVSILKNRFENNNLAILIKSGNVEIKDNNFLDDKLNISSDVQLALNENYLGSSDIDKFKLKGKIKIESFLDAPYPIGKKISMVQLVKQADKNKKLVLGFLKKGNYGKAVELYKKALKLSPDVNSYIYYIYALSMISDKSIERIIEDAIDRYPYEVRIYQLGIRYYLQSNQKDKAKRLWKRGLKLNPGNPLLTSLFYYFKESKDNKTNKKIK